MNLLSKRETITLFLGDVIFLFLSLFLSLFLRYNLSIDSYLFLSHLLPFSIIFVVWLITFFVFGLYERHTTVFLNRLPSTLFNAQITNAVIAVVFFYFIPFFIIAPKTNLFIFLLVSSIFLLFWRIEGYFFLAPKEKQKAILIGSGAELKELEYEIKHNKMIGLELSAVFNIDAIESIDFKTEVIQKIYSDNISIVAIDLANKKIEPFLSNLYNLIFSKVKFLDMHKVYEDTFNKIPLYLVRHNWFLENISSQSKPIYDSLKRILDITCSFLGVILSLIIYPFVILAIKLDDGGSVFIFQERVGKDNRIFKIIKFRTMERNDEGNYESKEKNNITKVGKWLRKSRIDELPQLLNVLKGDLSLIGPRPELPSLVKKYQELVSYYNVRHIIKPGLSGWAQLYHDNHPHHIADVEETKIKLSYDLFYIKNRSFILDIKIIFRTIKILLMFKGK